MKVLNTLQAAYNNAYINHPSSYGAKVVEAIRDYKFNNGQPLNILKAVYLLDAVNSMLDLGQCTKAEYKQFLDNLEAITGYSKRVLRERAFYLKSA